MAAAHILNLGQYGTDDMTAIALQILHGGLCSIFICFLGRNNIDCSIGDYGYRNTVRDNTIRRAVDDDDVELLPCLVYNRLASLGAKDFKRVRNSLPGRQEIEVSSVIQAEDLNFI